jgi:hypothetical protein
MSTQHVIPDVYPLYVWLCEISPLIWRRLLVRSDSTIADLHYGLAAATVRKPTVVLGEPSFKE